MEKTFIFDMDGVLIDSERLILACTLEAAPADCDREKFRQALTESLGVTYPEMLSILRARMGEGFVFDECEKRAEELYFARLAKDGLPVKTGARELISYLSEHGYALGLASSSSTRLVEMELGMVGLLSYFQQVVTGDMVEHSKPAPDIYLLAAERLGVAPSKAIAVEDSPKGVHAAAAAGIPVLMVPDLVPATDELRGICHGVFTTLLDVLDWVKACESKKSV